VHTSSTKPIGFKAKSGFGVVVRERAGVRDLAGFRSGSSDIASNCDRFVLPVDSLLRRMVPLILGVEEWC
jgi:hypothetical protein